MNEGKPLSQNQTSELFDVIINRSRTTQRPEYMSEPYLGVPGNLTVTAHHLRRHLILVFVTPN